MTTVDAAASRKAGVYEESVAGSVWHLADFFEEWFSVLDLRVNIVEHRLRIVGRAGQAGAKYNPSRIRGQVLNIIALSRTAVAARAYREQNEEEVSVCQLM